MLKDLVVRIAAVILAWVVGASGEAHRKDYAICVVGALRSMATDTVRDRPRENDCAVAC
jgi:hypothetical protein